jgi:ABC-type dipeptide/oligopeptide/nickel transport system permease component
MLSLLLRRFLWGFLGMLMVSLLVLGLFHLAPGDAATIMAGEHGSADDLAGLRAQLGLSASILQNWSGYWTNILLHGDFGRSLYSKRPVAGEILTRAPYTVALALAAMTIALGLGILAGLLAALHQGSWLDISLSSISVIGMAFPRFWLALMLSLVFSVHLGWLPVAGAESPRHLILPALCLGLPSAASFARLVRANALDVLHSSFLMVARAKGLPPALWVTRHLLRNCLIPTLTMAGIHFGHLLGGTFIIETLFGWPGLGRLTVQAVLDRDWPIVAGAAIAMTAVFTLISLATDILYGLLDPRLQAVQNGERPA